ncbi:MAG TPA: TonB-dependent receptor plug domain-containing protein, partial [Longimicrobiales bacterium]|nr:TonB-dependent receptor plug domain-containing protein [Longimicrobiales bacterium]
ARVAQDVSAGDDGLSLHLPGVDPRSIDRIEVIKGSAAEALYGAEAAGGVIQIFTKEAGAADTVFTVREVPEPEGGRIRALQEIVEVRARRDAAGGTYRLSEPTGAAAALDEITATAAERARGALRKLSEVGRSVLVRRPAGPEAEAVPSPLVVVDGVVRNRGSVDDLDPDRIASIEVLKGDAARAAYGSRGAGGVILITLKR